MYIYTEYVNQLKWKYCTIYCIFITCTDISMYTCNIHPKGGNGCWKSKKSFCLIALFKSEDHPMLWLQGEHRNSRFGIITNVSIFVAKNECYSKLKSFNFWWVFRLKNVVFFSLWHFWFVVTVSQIYSRGYLQMVQIKHRTNSCINIFSKLNQYLFKFNSICFNFN